MPSLSIQYSGPGVELQPIPTQALYTINQEAFHPKAPHGHGLIGTFVFPKEGQALESTAGIKALAMKGRKGAYVGAKAQQVFKESALHMPVRYLRVLAHGMGTKMVVAQCPLGTVPLGGGCTGGSLTVNAPSENPRGWKCGGTAESYIAEAFCSGEYGNLKTMTDIGESSVSADCEDGYSLIGGGCETSGRSEPMTGSRPGDAGEWWTCEVPMQCSECMLLKVHNAPL